MKKNKIYLIVFTLLLIMSVLIISVVFLLLLASDGYIYFKTASFVSPNKEYKIVIKGNGSKFPFGSEDIKIYAYKNKNFGFFKKSVYKTEIFNDGKPLKDDNFNISWEDNKALLTLKGEEQKNEYIEIDFQNNITFKHKKLSYKVSYSKEIKTIKSFSKNNYFSERDIELYNTNIDFLIDDKYTSMEKSFNQRKIDIEDFIITLDYEVEEKLATKSWESLGNADIYKNSDMTFIVCKYDRDNQDYESMTNINYLKYIISDSNLKYSYELCKPKVSNE